MTAVSEIDFEAEGLLDGVSGKARGERLVLLDELARDGVSLEELRQAVREDRLALLPAERVLSGDGGRYTLAEVAEAAGLDLDFLRRQRQALGLPVSTGDEPDATSEDLEAARRARAFLDAGLSEEGMLEVTRVIGMSVAQVAAAIRQLIADSYVEAGVTERELGLRLARAARELAPLAGSVLRYALGLHLREQVRHDVIAGTEVAAGRLPGASEVAVCFADLVGFTRLGERLEAEEIGGLAGRLSEIATEAARPPVRLVKMIGDAAMLVSPDTDALLEAALGLIETAEADERVPPLKAGIARGEALARGGDWYGRPVNLASRISAVARPSSVLVSAEVAERAGEGFSFSPAGRRRFKGIRGEVSLRRARRAHPDGAGSS
jgi:adenylate cyclase